MRQLKFGPAEKDLTCALCAGAIPQGDSCWFTPFSGRAEHSNCELYDLDFVKKKIIKEKSRGQ